MYTYLDNEINCKISRIPCDLQCGKTSDCSLSLKRPLADEI